MDSDCSVSITEDCGTKMSVMSDKDLEMIEEQNIEDLFSYYEEGQYAYISGSRNPYEKDSYAWKEWERGWRIENRRETMLDDCR